MIDAILVVGKDTGSVEGYGVHPTVRGIDTEDLKALLESPVFADTYRIVFIHRGEDRVGVASDLELTTDKTLTLLAYVDSLLGGAGRVGWVATGGPAFGKSGDVPVLGNITTYEDIARGIRMAGIRVGSVMSAEELAYRIALASPDWKNDLIALCILLTGLKEACGPSRAVEAVPIGAKRNLASALLTVTERWLVATETEASFEKEHAESRAVFKVFVNELGKTLAGSPHFGRFVVASDVLDRALKEAGKMASALL